MSCTKEQQKRDALSKKVHFYIVSEKINSSIKNCLSKAGIFTIIKISILKLISWKILELFSYKSDKEIQRINSGIQKAMLQGFNLQIF